MFCSYKTGEKLSLDRPDPIHHFQDNIFSKLFRSHRQHKTVQNFLDHIVCIKQYSMASEKNCLFVLIFLNLDLSPISHASLVLGSSSTSWSFLFALYKNKECGGLMGRGFFANYQSNLTQHEFFRYKEFSNGCMVCTP